MGFFKTLGKIAKAAAPVAASFIPGVGPIAGAAVGAALSGIGNQNQAGQLNKRALDMALERDRGLAPVRQRALGLALAPRGQREDLSGLFADPGNPYSRVVPRPAPSADLSRVAPASAPTAPPASGFAGVRQAITEARNQRAGQRAPGGKGGGIRLAGMAGMGGVVGGLMDRARAGGGGVGLLQRALAAKRGGATIGPDGLVRQPEGAL